MNTRIRILLALLGCLVFGANALGAMPGHCDPVCCDVPCESGPFAPPTDCACCAVRGAVASDPLLPSQAPPAPVPALLPEPPLQPAPTASTAATGFCPAPAPLPAPPRLAVLRL